MNLISPKSTKKSKIVGRGAGSGKGSHTTGRGTKGQKARSGYTKPRPGFEGGQNPISKRLPKLKGLSNAARTRKFKTTKIVNTPIKLSVIDEIFKADGNVTMESLIEHKIIKPLTHKVLNVKVVFDKDAKNKLNFEGIKLSKTAQASVEKVGGTVK